MWLNTDNCLDRGSKSNKTIEICCVQPSWFQIIKLTTESNRYLTNCHKHETMKNRKGVVSWQSPSLSDFLIRVCLIVVVFQNNSDCVLSADFLNDFSLTLSQLSGFSKKNRIYGSHRIPMQFLLNEQKGSPVCICILALIFIPPFPNFQLLLFELQFNYILIYLIKVLLIYSWISDCTLLLSCNCCFVLLFSFSTLN